MKKATARFCIVITLIILLAACNKADASGNIIAGESQAAEQSLEAPLPDTIYDSYYEGQRDQAFEYFKHKSIQRFLAMWVAEKTGDITEPEWNYDSFTRIRVLHNFLSEAYPDEPLYYCTFSDGADRYGYVIIKYNEDDPSISNCGVMETTPYQYDLRANADKISASLRKTDVDLSTATASRVCIFDKGGKRVDQSILFTDQKGDRYICEYGKSSFEFIEMPAAKAPSAAAETE